MKKSIYILFAVIVGLTACKQSKTAKSKTTTQPEIANIGGQPVYTSEFAYVYNKNNANAPDAYTPESINDYLNLYINFKLKVREAEQLGLDTGKAFKKELEGYKKQLAQPYFTEKSVTEKLTREAYDRMKEEVNASHILIKVGLDADPKDTLIAYNKIKDIREKAMKGESFEKLAQQYSEDPSAKNNKGNLGYFTAFGTIYSFETAAYNTPVGSISNPVRTQFGYHLIKVNDKRKSQGQVKVAHIMVRASEGLPESDSIAAKQKIDEIYNRLEKGEDWNQLVNLFSDDANSKSKNGELNWFSAGKMIPSFEEAAFALQTPGSISKPVLTPYGWHIIKLLERKQLEPFETLEPTIKSKVSKDRGEVNKKALLERLKKEDGFTEFPKTVDAAVALADSNILVGKWDYKPKANPKSKQATQKSNSKSDSKSSPVLFTIGKSNYTQEDFFKYVKQKQRPKKNISPAQHMRNYYKDFADESLMAYEESHLEDKYPDYRMLVKEYRDGILLFQLMDEKVWSKAIEDTAGLKKFFNDHRDKYKWDYRAHAKIFTAANEQTVEKLKVELEKKKFAVKDYATKEISYANPAKVKTEAVKVPDEHGHVHDTAPVPSASESETDKYITDEAKRTLDMVSHDLYKNKSYIVEFISSADYSEGIKVANERANSAKKYLINQGIDSTRITIVTKVGAKGRKGKDKDADRKLSINMYTTSAKELEKYFNANAPLTLQVTEGVFQKGENEVLNKVEWKEGSYTIAKNYNSITKLPSDSVRYYVVISKIDEPRLKTFEEARGLTISDYQSYLEHQWIEELKKKYPVSINNAEVQNIKKP